MRQAFKVGDKVTFDNDNVSVFIAETTNVSTEITQYQKMVLASIDQVGTVQEYGPDMTTVLYDDGWALPVPTKYLILLPKE
jgi:hypothetical protein